MNLIFEYHTFIVLAKNRNIEKNLIHNATTNIQQVFHFTEK